MVLNISSIIPNLLLYTLAILLTLLIGIFVLIKKKGSKTSLFFTIICFSIAFWTVANYFALNETNPNVILFWIRMVMALAVIQSISFFLFIHTFPKSKIQLDIKKLLLLLFAGLLTIILSFTPLLFKSVNFTDTQRTPEPAFGIIIFVIVAVGSLLYGFALLIMKLRKSTGLTRIQLKYILFGFLLMFLLMLVFNFILVVVFNNSSFVNFAPIFTLPFIIFISVAIVKHRLMGIRFVIRRGTIYTVTAAIIFVIYTALVFIVKEFFTELTPTNTYILNSVAIIIIALGFEPLRRSVRKIIDQWFFPERKRLEKSLDKIKSELPKTVDLKKFTQAAVSEINNIIPVQRIQFFLLDKKEGIYHLVFPEEEKERIQLRLDNVLIRFILDRKEIIVREELPMLFEGKSEVEKEELVKIEKEMDNYGWSLALPIGFERPNGILFLEAKQNKEAYTLEDFNFLETLKIQASSALDNAILYKEAVERIKVIK